MIDLTAPQHELLTRVVDAGDEGFSFKTEPSVGVGDLIKLGLDGLVRVPRGQNRVFATDAGKAFVLRVTA